MQRGLKLQAMISIFDQSPPFFANVAGVVVFNEGFGHEILSAHTALTLFNVEAQRKFDRVGQRQAFAIGELGIKGRRPHSLPGQF